MSTRTRLTSAEGTSAKFWEVDIQGAELHITWGKIGSSGQRQTKTLASADAAAKEAKKLIAEKAKKGYVADTADAGGAAGGGPAAAEPPETEPVTATESTKKAKAAPKKTQSATAKRARKAPATPLWGGLAVVDGKITTAFPATFESVRGGFREAGLCAVMRDGKWGYIDRTGATRIPFVYDDAWWFEGGFACARRGDVFAVDTQGGEHASYPLHRGEGATVMIDAPKRDHESLDLYGQTRLVAADGRELATNTNPFGPISEVAPGWFYVGRNTYDEPSRVIDREGRSVPGLEGKDLMVFVDGRAWAFGQRQTFVRLDGSVLPGEWESCESFAEGFAKVRAGYRREGFIDREGQVLGALVYQDAFSFDGGVARVRVAGGGMGLIDTTGAFRVPAIHTSMRPQKHGRVAGERQGGGWMLYETTTGQPVLETPYDDLEGLLGEPIYRVRRGAKWGVIDRDGRILVPLEHDGVAAFGGGFVAVNRGANAKGIGGLWGIVDLAGRLVVPPRYTGIGFVRDGVALVQEPPVDESESWPFRFYGPNPAHWAEGANMGHDWRAHFASSPWGEHRDRIVVAIEGELAKGGEFGGIAWDGAFALLRAGEKKGGARKLFAAVRRAFEAAHEVIPLREVVFLGAQVASVDDGKGADAWERWSIRQQAEVDRGPDFGLDACLFSLA